MGTPKVAGNGDIAFRLNLLGAKSMIVDRRRLVTPLPSYANKLARRSALKPHAD
jgi:hypothetical protein